MTKTQSELGAFYTEGDPFGLSAFAEFAEECGLNDGIPSVIEPFAGSNNLIKKLEERYRFDSLSFDINPQAEGVWEHDSIEAFPQHWHNYPRIVVTNPPWLAKNSAKRQGLGFPDTTHNDLYKLCLDRCLDGVPYVAMLVPASFIQSNFDCRRRLLSYTLIHSNKFFATEHPTALVCFGESSYVQPSIYYDDEYINSLDSIHSFMPAKRVNREVKCNVPDGEIGLKAFDGVKDSDKIEFVHGYDIPSEKITNASRFYTRFSMKLSDREQMDHGEFIARANDALNTYRAKSRDVMMTPFKSKMDDGQYRRRLSYKQAITFLNSLDFA